MVLHVRDTQEYPNGWAKLVSELINRPGWNRTRLAREAGINRNTVRRWIDGESSNISASSIRLIADAADIDYQVAAVKIAAHHLNTRHGVVIGDVVGSCRFRRRRPPVLAAIRPRRKSASRMQR